MPRVVLKLLICITHLIFVIYSTELRLFHNMLKNLLGLSILFSFSLGLFGQVDFDHYTPVVCKGKIPTDLTASAKLSYEKKALKIEDSDKGKRRKDDEKDFYLQNNFSIQDFLISGQVLYNDTFTRYIEKIADVLLKDNPALRKKLRFYTVKSPDVNAFATQEGIVFVNIGLFSSAKSEAQIAYILAHEISHFTEGHVLQGFLETRKIVRGEGYYRYQDYYSRLRSFFRYSRDSEYEADEKGWELFKKSDYAKGIVQGVFEMLLYAHIHYDSIEFNPSSFEEKEYKFPKSYHLEQVDPLNVDEAREDDYSTHPNVKDRKKRAFQMIGSDSTGGNLYLVSEASFKNLQKRARYEMLRFYITNTNFADAYYHALLLENSYKPGKYIDLIKGMALYGMAKHYNTRGKHRNLILPYKNVQSLPQQFYYFMHQLSNKEMTVLALRENSKLYDKYPNSTFFKQVQKDLMHLLIVENKSRPEDFHTSWPIQGEEKIGTDQTYYKYAFVDKLADPYFYQNLQSFETYYEKKNRFYKKNKFKKKGNLELGKLKDLRVNQLSLFQPSFQKVVQGITEMPKVDYLASLEEANYLNDQLKVLAAEQNIKLNFIEQKPEQYTTRSYNLYSEYVNWFMERTHNNMKMVYQDLPKPADTAVNKEEFVGVLEVQSVVKNILIKKLSAWEYTFIVFDKQTGEMVFYQSQESFKKYKRKKASKALNTSLFNLQTNYNSEE